MNLVEKNFFSADNCEFMQKLYRNKNYKIEVLNEKSDICMIFFSSNGLYDPYDSKDFYKEVVCRNKFEWKNIAENILLNDYIGQRVFVRDLFRKWYLNGINNKINTIEKLAKLLREISQGRRIITVGSSSGGYMAMLMGSLLNATACFSFSGQFSIKQYLEDVKYFGYDHMRSVNPNTENENIIEILKKCNIPVWHFYPAECLCDINQLNLIKDVDNVFCFAVSGEEHSRTISMDNIPYLLTMDNDKLCILHEQYRGKIIQRDEFFLSTLQNCDEKYINLLNHIKKKFEESIANRDIYLFGSGLDCESFVRFHQERFVFNGIFDNDKQKQNKQISGLSIYHSSKLDEIDAHKIVVIITSTTFYRDIKLQLERKGVHYIFQGALINILYNDKFQKIFKDKGVIK